MSELYLPGEESAGWGRRPAPCQHPLPRELWVLAEPSAGSRPPPRPRTYQVPEQEDHDAHHQRAQPEEPQAPVALPAETAGIGPLREAQSCPSPKLSTPPAPLSPGKTPRGSGTPSPPRCHPAHRWLMAVIMAR